MRIIQRTSDKGSAVAIRSSARVWPRGSRTSRSLPAPLSTAYRVRMTNDQGDDNTWWFCPDNGCCVKRKLVRAASSPSGQGIREAETQGASRSVVSAPFDGCCESAAPRQFRRIGRRPVCSQLRQCMRMSATGRVESIDPWAQRDPDQPIDVRKSGHSNEATRRETRSTRFSLRASSRMSAFSR